MSNETIDLSNYQIEPLFQFGRDQNGRNWRIITDQVMGGISRAGIIYDDDQSLTFQGEVSLENGGGFTSIRSPKGEYDFSSYQGLILRLHTDNRRYRLSLRDSYETRVPSFNYFFSNRDYSKPIVVPFSKLTYQDTKERNIEHHPFAPSQIKQLYLMLFDGNSGPFRLKLEEISLYYLKM